MFPRYRSLYKAILSVTALAVSLCTSMANAQGLIWNESTKRKWNNLPEYFQSSKNALARTTAQNTLPLRADIRDIIGSTPIKNQGGCGSCVTNAIITNMEYNLRLQLIRDSGWTKTFPQFELSVNQALNCLSLGCAPQYDEDILARLSSSQTKITLRYPWETSQDDFSRNPMCLTSSKAGYTAASATKFKITSTYEAKKALLYGHSILAWIMANDATKYGSESDFKIDSKFAQVVPTTGYTNHLVTVIGYDDIEYGGVWLVQNSWGSGAHDNGIIKVKYGAANIGYFGIIADVFISSKLPPEIKNGGCDPSNCENALFAPSLPSSLSKPFGTSTNRITDWILFYPDNRGGFVQNWTLDYGDGSVITPTGNGSATTITAQPHRYKAPGKYTIKLTARNMYGSSTGSSTIDVATECIANPTSTPCPNREPIQKLLLE